MSGGGGSSVWRCIVNDPHADPDMLRHEPPCEHAWRFLDTFDLWYCTLCKRHESPDDDPDGPVAA